MHGCGATTVNCFVTNPSVYAERLYANDVKLLVSTLHWLFDLVAGTHGEIEEQVELSHNTEFMLILAFVIQDAFTGTIES